VKVFLRLIQSLWSQGLLTRRCNGLHRSGAAVYLYVISADYVSRTLQCGITHVRGTFGSASRYITWHSRIVCEDPICRLSETFATDWWVCQWPSLAHMVQNENVIHSVQMPSIVCDSVALSNLRSHHLGLLPHLAILLHSTWETLLSYNGREPCVDGTHCAHSIPDNR
jgi:hypothetical protein